MDFKPILLIGFLVLCCITVSTANDGNDVTITLRQRSVTGSVEDLVKVLGELGIRIPPKVRAFWEQQRRTGSTEPNTPN